VRSQSSFTEDEIKGETEKDLAANRQKLKPDAVFLNARPRLSSIAY